MSKQVRNNQSEIIILCLNPDCQEPSQRCLDSRTIRTHPSDCSRHYFSVDSILSTSWLQLPDYPSDPLGISTTTKLHPTHSNPNPSSTPYLTQLLTTLKQTLCSTIDTFSEQLYQYLPSSRLEELYTQTYCLDAIAQHIREDCNGAFVSKCVNGNFGGLTYGALREVNGWVDRIGEAFEVIHTGVRNQLKALLDSFSTQKSKPGTTSTQSYRVSQQKMKPKIELGLTKSKFISSAKIECKEGRITFPKLDNIVSFLPWIYTDRGFESGVHEMRITSLRFPSVGNAGLCVLEEHDIDTYPYHNFKSLFSKQGKNFILAQPETKTNSNSNSSSISEIQHIIGQTSEIILRLQLNSKPKPLAFIYNVERTCTYVCQLSEGKKYRMGVYGSGWMITVNQLW